jgi:hypothetical protein
MPATTKEGPRERPLLPHHRAYLHDRAVDDEAIAARGYWTATKGAELGRLGFAVKQRIVPSLVIPLYGLDGTIVGYQTRPDEPRIGDNGKPVKFESPAGGTVVLDVPRAREEELRSVSRSLWITEGAAKVDAAVSAGLTCVGLLGVNCLRATAEGVRTILPDLHRLPLEERKVVIAFDADVMEKPTVHAALEALAGYLESRGAIVHALYLPALGGDEHTGLDDYLAAGHSVDELWRLVEPGIRPLVVLPQRPPLPTATLLEAVERLIRRFVRFTDERGDHELTILALYVLHTYALSAAYATPYLRVRSPAKRAGKTRLLEVLELVCRNAQRAGSITAAAVFQLIEAERPTLLIDEIDTIFTARNEQAEALRGILNDGYRPGGYAIRGTQDGAPVKFSTWCPKVLAGIENNSLPDTIEDRCLTIGLERKLKTEAVERLRERALADEVAELRERLEDWALVATERLPDYEVPTIAEISDRAEEIAEPLLAIADDAGGAWPERALEAVRVVADGAGGEWDYSTLLLVKLRDLFGPVSVMSSRDIVKALRSDDDLPFPGIDARELASMLRPFGVRPGTVRPAGASGTARGYHRKQLADAFTRYLPEYADTSDTSDTSQSQSQNPVSDEVGASDTSDTSAGGPTHETSDEHGDVSDVSDVSAGSEGVRERENGDGPIDRAALRQRMTEGWGQ